MLLEWGMEHQSGGEAALARHTEVVVSSLLVAEKIFSAIGRFLPVLSP